MIVDVILAAGEVSPQRVERKSVAVIDVFRATSVITEAVRNGARAVVPVVGIDTAFEMRRRYGGSGEVILGGERNALIVEGFDKGNSPLAYAREEVEGKTVVLSTTNGTRAIRNSEGAHAVYIASLLNMEAVCEILASDGRDVVLVCSGREDAFTAEDGLCAGAMVETLVRGHAYRATDIAQVMQEMYVHARHDLRGRLSTTRHYNHLLGLGYGADIDFCLQRDIYDIVPVYRDGEIKQFDYGKENENSRTGSRKR